MRVGLAFGLLIALNIYFLFFRHGTSVQSLLKRARAPQLAASVPSPHSSARKPEIVDDKVRFADGVVRAGDTVWSLAQSQGFSVRDGQLLEQLFAHQPDAPVAAGDGWEVRYDAMDRPLALTIRRAAQAAVVMERAGDAFSATRETRRLDVRRVELSAQIGTALDEAVVKAGERPALARALLDVLAGELDYPADVQPQDRFTVVIEKQFLDGAFVRYGHVLGAEWVGHAASWRAFYYDGAYYNEHGESAERLWRKSPLRPNPTASLKERHRAPLLHLTAQGRWVEYFGAAGAEVVAVRDGHVAFIGPGAVTIAHDDGMQTQYRHLARHVTLRPGQLVAAGQLLGWVSTTPAQATLQFSLLQAGASIDPLSQRAPRLRPLDNDQRLAFADIVAPRLAQLAALRGR